MAVTKQHGVRSLAEGFQRRLSGAFLKLVAMSSELQMATQIGKPFWVLLVLSDVGRREFQAIDCTKMAGGLSGSAHDKAMNRLMPNYDVLEVDSSIEGTAWTLSQAAAYAEAKGYTTPCS